MARKLLLFAAVAAALVVSTTATASSSPSCTIRGTDRSETLSGTHGRDVICGKGGNDRLRGLGGDDVLLGGDGNDVLDGGAGSDDVRGEKGNDLADGGDGTDSVSGGDGNDALGGGAGNDVVSGDAGSDLADGGSGNDSVAGGDGHDVLAGSAGKDTLDGGGGTDAFAAGGDDDSVKARDGKRDVLISCGSGNDELVADAGDPGARDCERNGTTLPPAPKADLSVSLTDNVDPVVEGDAVEYRFRVDNAGPSAATGVTVATTVPADATVAAADGCTQAGSVVTCALGSVASGASATGALTVTHGSTGTKTVTSVVGSPVADPASGNDSASQTTVVEARPAPQGADLSVSVSAAPSALTFAEVPYTVTVSNAGPEAAQSVSLRMEPDAAWSAISRPTGCPQSVFPVTRVTCSLGTLAAGESVTRVMGVSWGEAGNRTVLASVTGSGPADPVAANNSETETTTVSG